MRKQAFEYTWPKVSRWIGEGWKHGVDFPVDLLEVLGQEAGAQPGEILNAILIHNGIVFLKIEKLLEELGNDNRGKQACSALASTLTDRVGTPIDQYPKVLGRSARTGTTLNLSAIADIWWERRESGQEDPSALPNEPWVWRRQACARLAAKAGLDTAEFTGTLMSFASRLTVGVEGVEVIFTGEDGTFQAGMLRNLLNAWREPVDDHPDL